MASFLACENCHEVVVKGLHDEVKVRAKVILIRDDKVLAVCKGCDAELQVPLKYDEALAKALPMTSGPRLYLKK
jgi:RNase P subunit RPR2